MEYFAYNKINLKDYKKITDYKVEKALENFLIIENKSGEYGTINYEGDVLIEPKFDSIRELNDGIYISRKGYLYGLIDNKGYKILDLKYSYIEKFNNGFSIVREKSNSYQGLYGVIDINGNEIIPCKYKSINVLNDCFLVDTILNKGLIDKNDAFIISPIYDYIYHVKNNIYIIEKDGLFGLVIDKKTVIEPKYTKLEYLCDDRYLVCKGNKKYVINGADKKIIKLPKHVNTTVWNGIIIVNLNKICIGLVINNGNEYKEVNFKVIIDLSIISYHGDYAIAKTMNGYYTIINKKGDIVLKEEYHNITYDISNNLFRLLLGDGSVKYIDNNLKEVSNGDIIYHSNKKDWINNKFSDVKKISDNTFLATRGKNTYFLNNEGIITKIENKLCFLQEFGMLVILAFKFYDELYYMLYDINGNKIIDLIDSEILIINSNKIIIDSCIIDLSYEYLNINYSYELKMKKKNKIIDYSFKTDDARSNYLKEVLEFEDKKEKKVELLEQEIDAINGLTYDEYLIIEDTNKMVKSLNRWIK